jgi:hypothetical protein
MTQTTKTRVHCYNEHNVKIIKLQRDKPLEQLPNHSPWQQGTGPHSPEARANIKAALRNTLKGVPKTEEKKRKMSIAKLGKPKTAEHKANMSAAHRKRLARIQDEKAKQISGTNF